MSTIQHTQYKNFSSYSVVPVLPLKKDPKRTIYNKVKNKHNAKQQLKEIINDEYSVGSIYYTIA